MPIEYVITVREHLDDHWPTWFEGLTITKHANGEAVLVGPLVDQAALHGVLINIRDLGLPLIAVIPRGIPTGVIATMHGDEPGPTSLRKET